MCTVCTQMASDLGSAAAALQASHAASHHRVWTCYGVTQHVRVIPHTHTNGCPSLHTHSPRRRGTHPLGVAFQARRSSHTCKLVVLTNTDIFVSWLMPTRQLHALIVAYCSLWELSSCMYRVEHIKQMQDNWWGEAQCWGEISSSVLTHTQTVRELKYYETERTVQRYTYTVGQRHCTNTFSLPQLPSLSDPTTLDVYVCVWGKDEYEWFECINDMSVCVWNVYPRGISSEWTCTDMQARDPMVTVRNSSVSSLHMTQ